VDLRCLSIAHCYHSHMTFALMGLEIFDDYNLCIAIFIKPYLLDLTTVEDWEKRSISRFINRNELRQQGTSLMMVE
jgi:hypothetical protein